MIENDYEYPCPYCGVTLSLRLDPSGGKKQDFVYDCEICCRPIHIRAEFENEEVTSFSAEQEE